MFAYLKIQIIYHLNQSLLFIYSSYLIEGEFGNSVLEFLGEYSLSKRAWELSGFKVYVVDPNDSINFLDMEWF